MEQKEMPNADRGRADFLTMGLGAGLARLFTAWELLAIGEAILVAWLVAYSIGYWLPPKPPESFGRWIRERLIFLVALYLAFFKVPVILKQWLPTIMAYGIPILIFLLASVWSIIRVKPLAMKGAPNKSLKPTAR